MLMSAPDGELDLDVKGNSRSRILLQCFMGKFLFMLVCAYMNVDLSGSKLQCSTCFFTQQCTLQIVLVSLVCYNKSTID